MFSLVLIVVCLQLLMILSTAHEVVTKDVGSKKILTFPAQLKLHLEGKVDQNAASQILSVEDFMGEFLSLLKVTEESIKIEREEKLSIGTKVSHYQQFINGILVYCAKVIVTTGRHGGVIKALGESLIPNNPFFELDAAPTVQVSTALENLNTFIVEKYGCPHKVDIKTTGEELLYYRVNLGSVRAAVGSPILVHHINGNSVVDVDDKNLGIVYDAFIDASTGKVVDFLLRESL